MDFEFIKNKFMEYVNLFDTSNKYIKARINHSLRVSNLGNILAQRLNFSEEEILLARVIGILHDIGRFEQIKQKNTFIDTNKLDHADIGVELLFDKNKIKEFKIDKKNHEIIKNSIYYHNKFDIPNNLDKNNLKFIKLIRDIDKIDIFRVQTEEFENIMNDKITLKDELKIKKVIDYSNTTNASDRILVHIYYIFDINYEESYDILNENHNFKDYINSIEISDDNFLTFNKVKQFIKNNTKIEL